MAVGATRFGRARNTEGTMSGEDFRAESNGAQQVFIHGGSNAAYESTVPINPAGYCCRGMLGSDVNFHS